MRYAVEDDDEYEYDNDWKITNNSQLDFNSRFLQRKRAIFNSLKKILPTCGYRSKRDDRMNAMAVEN
jgi:hypothetical protein